MLNAWLLSFAIFVGLIVWFGPVIIPWLLGQAVIGVCLLESVNYLEHCVCAPARWPGSLRASRPAAHFNSNTPIANVFLYHLQRHSDHHANPQTRYQTLRHADQAPQLPTGYGSDAGCRLWCPPIWRRPWTTGCWPITAVTPVRRAVGPALSAVRVPGSRNLPTKSAYRRGSPGGCPSSYVA